MPFHKKFLFLSTFLGLCILLILSLTLLHQTTPLIKPQADALIPASQQTSLLVPLYMFPDRSQNFPGWTQLTNLALAHPSTHVYAIINHQGTNIFTDSYARAEFQDGINLLHTAGISVLGYIDSGLSARTIAASPSTISPSR